VVANCNPSSEDRRQQREPLSAARHHALEHQRRPTLKRLSPRRGPVFGGADDQPSVFGNTRTPADYVTGARVTERAGEGGTGLRRRNGKSGSGVVARAAPVSDLN
jgi:hypothetical protein